MHTLALSVDGHVYSWGYGLSGALGNGGTHSCCRPSRVHLPRCVYIAAQSVSVAITHAGEAFLWGKSAYITPGSAYQEAAEGVPVVLPGLKGRSACFAACGVAHAVVFLQDGSIVFWGREAHLPGG